MKNFILLFMVVIFLFSETYAQNENGSPFVWGMRLGINWATITSDNKEGLEARTSGVIGAFTRHKLGENFVVQPEINYTLKGAARRIVDNNDLQFDYSLSFDFFEIPVLLKYNFGSTVNSKFKPELFVGPFLAFKLSSSLKLDDVPNSDIDITNVKSTDYGLAFGTGMGFKIDNVDLLLELRYTLSLSSFDDNVAQSDLVNGKYRVFSITTGFVIN
ncbi:MAG: hypothetical protein A2068_10310 [Ignavibacteria bacterium GWB2_35_6b]|nr:MAG: hypothetical protein A2068_10310 [Ignavibacteria bacterium GWB2_35_6b]